MIEFSDIVASACNVDASELNSLEHPVKNESILDYLSRVKPALGTALRDVKAESSDGKRMELVRNWGAGSPTTTAESIDNEKLLTTVLQNHGFPFAIGFDKTGHVSEVNGSARFSDALTHGNLFDIKSVIHNMTLASCVAFSPDSASHAEAFEGVVESQIHKSSAFKIMFSAKGSVSVPGSKTGGNQAQNMRRRKKTRYIQPKEKSFSLPSGM